MFGFIFYKDNLAYVKDDQKVAGYVTMKLSNNGRYFDGVVFQNTYQRLFVTHCYLVYFGLIIH